MNVKLFSSILDYPHPGLDPTVWGQDGKLLPENKDEIFSKLNDHLVQANLKSPEKWITSLHIVGSLTTYQYAKDTDVDLHVGIDFPAFQKYEKPELSAEDAEKFLDELRKAASKEHRFLPNTQHPIEFYFLTPSAKEDTSHVGVYDLYTDKWVKPPVAINADFDIEESQPKFIEDAMEVAAEIDESFGKIKQHVRRIEDLQDVIKEWSTDKRKSFEKKLQDKLEAIEQEIETLVKTKKELVDARHTKTFDPESEHDIKFKYLQKFGYFFIISRLRDLFDAEVEDVKVTEQDIPKIKEIVDCPVNVQGDLNKAAHNIEPSDPGKGKLMIDFDNTIAVNSHEHEIVKAEPGVKEALEKFKDDGWEIIIYSGRANTPEGIDEIKKFMEGNQLPYDEIFVGKPDAELYIDDRNIVFTTWSDAMKTVDKHKEHSPSKKKASLGDVRVWLSPNGKVYKLDDGETHQGWAERLGVNSGRGELSSYDLINMGWVRIGDTYEDYSAFNVELKSLKNIPDFVNDFVASNYTGGKIEVEDNNETVEIENPFPNIQKAVNDALRRKRMVGKVAQHDVQYEFTSTHFNMPKDVTQKILEWSVQNIPNEDLYDDGSGKFERELESHMTILFGLLTNDSSEVESLLKDEKPVKVKFGKTDVFEDKDKDAIFIAIESDGAEALHKKLKTLDNEDQQPNYHPHCTVAYVKSGLGKKYAGADILDGLELELDTVKFSPKEGDPVFIELGKTSKKEASIDKYIHGYCAEYALVLSKKLNKPIAVVRGYLGNDDGFVDSHAFVLLSNTLGQDAKGVRPISEIVSETAWVQQPKKIKIEQVSPEELEASMGLEQSVIDDLKKEAALMEFPIHGKKVKVYKNPTLDEAELCFNESQEPSVRYYMDVNGNIYLWDAFAAEHAEVVRSIGHEYSYSDNTGFFTKLEQVVHFVEDYWKSEAERDYWRKRDREEMNKTKVSSLNIIASFIEKKAKLHWFVPGDAPQVVDPSSFDLRPEVYEEYLNKGYIAMDDQSSPPKVLVWDFETTPDWLDRFLNEKVGYGYVDLVDRGGRSFPVHLPTKNIKRQIQRELYRPENVNAAFMPSITQAPDNPHQTDSDVEIPVDPDTTSEEETSNKDFLVDKPKKGLWQSILDMFKGDKKEASVKKKASKARGWLDPNGKFYRFGDFNYSDWEGVTHDDWAIANAGMINDTYGISGLDEEEGENPTSILIDHGWTRISDDFQKVGVHLQDIHHIPDFVEDHLSSTVGSDTFITVEDATGQWVELTDWGGGLQEAVNHELQMKRMIERQQQPAASLHRKAYLEHAYWIAPDSKVFTVRKAGTDSKYTHGQWGKRNREKLRQIYNLDIDPSWDSYQVTEYMLDAGWVRIGDAQSGKGWAVMLSDVHKIPSVVDNILAEFLQDGETVAVESLSSGDYIEVEYPWRSLQNEVNRQYRAQNQKKEVPIPTPEEAPAQPDTQVQPVEPMQEAASLGKKALDFKFWISPQGEYFKVHGIHVDWIKEHWDDLGFNELYDLPQKDAYEDDLDKAYDHMIKDLGWARVTVGDSSVQFLVSVNDILHLPPTVEPFVEQYFDPNIQKGVWFNDYQDNNALVDDPIGDLQEKINYEITHPARVRQYAMLKKADVLTDILKLVKETGGATWNFSQGNMAGTPNFAVSIYPEHSVIIDHELTVQDLYTYITNKRALLLKPENSLGIWKSGNKYYLDVTVTIPDREKAIELGKKHNQISIFDLQTFQEIPTGGTGEVQSKKAAAEDEYWINPQGEVFHAPEGHSRWILQNLGTMELPASYFGVDIPSELTEEDAGEINEIREEMLRMGWVRIGSDEIGDDQFIVEVDNLKKIPSTVDNFIAEHFREGQGPIFVGTPYSEDGGLSVYNPFPNLQKAVNKELRRPRAASLSKFSKSIEEVRGIKVLVNPTPNEVRAFWQKSREKQLRALIDPHTGDIFVWDAYLSEHNSIIRYYDLDIDWESDDGTYIRHVAHEPDIASLFDEQNTVKQKIKTSSLSKHARFEGTAWVDPEGKIFRVKRTHAHWVYDNIDMLEQKYGYSIAEGTPDTDPELLVRDLLEYEWTRIADWTRGAGYIQVADLNQVPPGLQPFLDENYDWGNGGAIVIDDMSGTYAEVTVTGDIQEDIKNALRLYPGRKVGKALSSLIEKTAFSAHAYWIDPKGKAYEVRGAEMGRDSTHADWVVRNREMLARKYKIRLPRGIEEEQTFDINSVLIEKGWTRIGDYHGSQIGIRTLDIHHIPSAVEDVLVSFAKEGDRVHVEDIYQNEFSSVVYPFKSLQSAVNRDLMEQEQQKRKNIERHRREEEEERKRQEEENQKLHDELQEVPIPQQEVQEPVEKKPEQLELPLVGKKIVMDEEEFKKEHERLLKVLKSPSHKDDLEEYERQKKELEEHTKDSALGQWGGYWIAPSGEVYRMKPDEEHNDWIIENKDVDPDKAFTLGWVRARMVEDDMFIEVMNLASIPDYVNDFLIKRRAENIIIEDRSMVSIEIPYHDAIEDGIQQAVNNALHRPKVAYKGPATTVENTEPFTPLPTTFEWGTNDDNLNFRYPWKFMRKPTGPDTSNEEEVNDMLIEDEEMPLSKHADDEEFPQRPYGTFGIQGAGFWIDPNGEVFKVDPEQDSGVHGNWIVRNHPVLKKKYGIDITKVWDTPPEYWDLINYFVDKGWVRVSSDYSSGNISYGIYMKDLRNIPTSVDDFIMQHGGASSSNAVVLEDISGQHFEVEDNDELARGLNKVVRRHLRPQQMDLPMAASLGLSKHALTMSGYWVAPDGKVFEVRSGGKWDTHGNWVFDNLNMLKRKYGIKSADKNADYFTTAREMLEKGWARIGDTAVKRGVVGIEVASIRNIPSYIDDAVASFATDGEIIIVADLNENWAEIVWPVKSIQSAVARNRGRRASQKTAYSDKDVKDEAYGLWQQALEAWDAKVHPIERFIMENGGIAAYKPSGETGRVEEREEYRGIPVRLRGTTSYDEMIDLLKSEHILDQDAGYGDLYEIISHLPERGRRPRLSDFIEEAKHNLEYNEEKAAMLPREKLYDEAGNLSNTYSDSEMEKIYDEQHSDEMKQDDGGGYTPRDFNDSSTDYPKPEDTQRKQKIQLDLLEPTQTPPIPSYEVTWYFGSPADDNGSM